MSLPMSPPSTRANTSVNQCHLRVLILIFLQGIFVCGGGYQFESADVVQVASLNCFASSENCTADWLADRDRCCAPGVTCGAADPKCGPADPYCCSRFIDERQCLAAGCALCGTTCTAYDYAFYANGSAALTPPCTASTTFHPRGSWRLETYECTSASPSTGITPGGIRTICNDVARNQYLGIYADACGSNAYTDACLAEARTRVSQAAWPMLTADDAPVPGKRYSLKFPDGTFLGFGARVASGLGAPAMAVENTTVKVPKIWLTPSAETTVAGASEYYIQTIDGGYDMCLVVPTGAGPEQWQLQLQDLGTILGTRDAAYWRVRNNQPVPLDVPLSCTSLALKLGKLANRTVVGTGTLQELVLL
jgi:hypothetical protein